MGQTECSEMSAYKIQTPGNYPKESIQKKKWPALTHPLKLGSKTYTCSTLGISSYQILTTTWKQIIITKVLPVCMSIIQFQSYTSASIHFLWRNWHIRDSTACDKTMLKCHSETTFHARTNYPRFGKAELLTTLFTDFFHRWN